MLCRYGTNTGYYPPVFLQYIITPVRNPGIIKIEGIVIVKFIQMPLNNGIIITPGKRYRRGAYRTEPAEGNRKKRPYVFKARLLNYVLCPLVPALNKGIENMPVPFLHTRETHKMRLAENPQSLTPE